MCGIVGAIRNNKNAADFLIDGLQRLEYRGYDSSGIAVLTADGKIQRIRRVGRVAEMADACRSEQVFGTLGIGHTRWATHGGVTEPNAHPHISGSLIAVVHNGIIENFAEERERLQNAGYTFSSQTDTEVIAHAVHQEYLKNNDLFSAVKNACRRFQGAYAIGVIAADKPDELVAVRMGCPLLVALGENENFIASDVSAVIAHTRKVMYLQDGDAVKLSSQGIDLMTDLDNQPISREIKLSELSLSSLELGEFSHFMQKEIHEQPQALTDTIKPLLNENFAPEIFGENAPQLFNGLKGIKILACGTSFYAALTAKYWLESIAKIPTDAEIASEYRYREVIADPDILVITISQSGETLDTMEALKYAQKLGHNRSLSICNVMESALPRESCAVFYTRAGAEIGVASTKAFTTQLVALFGLAVCLGCLKGLIDDTQKQQYAEELRRLPNSVRHALNLEPQITVWAKEFANKNNALFLGRGIHYPIALEGALKLKEISYIHAEAYPAGELKHGPLALVDEKMPVVVVAPNDKLLDKVKANMQEVAARGGRLFVFTDDDSNITPDNGVAVIRLPRHVGLLSPIVHCIPVQLLAYHTALALGTDVDKPRNLAKSVTVE